MTPAELEALEAACSAATPGPWESIAHLDSRVSPSVFSEACIWTEKEVLLGSVTSSYADGDFIAAARTAMPRLLAALRAAEARVAWLEGSMCGRCGAIKGTHGSPCIDDQAFMVRISALRAALASPGQGEER